MSETPADKSLPEPSGKPAENAPDKVTIEGGYELYAEDIEAARAAAAEIEPSDVDEVMFADQGGTAFWGGGAIPACRVVPEEGGSQGRIDDTPKYKGIVPETQKK